MVSLDGAGFTLTARRPLGQQQRVAAVRFRRRRPQRVLVRAETDEEHSHALLRHAVVGRVHQLERDAVLAGGARLVLPFAQAGQVVAPLLLRLCVLVKKAAI